MRILPQGPGHAVFWREAWSSREIFYSFVGRELALRYRHTLLGAAWAVVQPLTSMVLFSLVMGSFAKLPSDGAPYPVFVLVGWLPWQWFAFSLNQSAKSLFTHQHLIRKIYFPRLYIPLSIVTAGMVDFLVGFVILLGFLAIYGIPVSGRAVFLPAFFCLTAIVCLAVSLWMAALTTRFRDIHHTLSFLTQVWFFATPIAYSGNLVPEPWHVWLALNPVLAAVEVGRWALLPGATLSPIVVLVSSAVALVAALTGLLYFQSVERTFDDFM